MYSIQLIETIQKVLQSGILPVTVERQLLHRLLSTRMSAQEKAALDQLVDAMQRGNVRSVAG